MSQKLRGWVGQAMNGAKRPFTGSTYNFPAGSYTFTPSRAGFWKFVGWSAGCGTTIGSGVPGTSGAYGEKTVHLTIRQSVAIVVGVGSSGTGGTTTLTFPDATVMTLTGAAAGVPGVATGGDVNLAGSAAGSAGLGTGGGLGSGGGGAPANLPFRGGKGTASNTLGSTTPGGGPGSNGSNDVAGGDGQVLALLVR